MTKKWSVSIAFPGPTNSSHQPGSGFAGGGELAPGLVGDAQLRQHAAPLAGEGRAVVEGLIARDDPVVARLGPLGDLPGVGGIHGSLGRQGNPGRGGEGKLGGGSARRRRGRTTAARAGP